MSERLAETTHSVQANIGVPPGIRQKSLRYWRDNGVDLLELGRTGRREEMEEKLRAEDPYVKWARERAPEHLGAPTGRVVRWVPIGWMIIMILASLIGGIVGTVFATRSAQPQSQAAVALSGITITLILLKYSFSDIYPTLNLSGLGRYDLSPMTRVQIDKFIHTLGLKNYELELETDIIKNKIQKMDDLSYEADKVEAGREQRLLEAEMSEDRQRARVAARQLAAAGG